MLFQGISCAMITHREIVLATLTEEAAIRFLQAWGVLRQAWVCSNECGTDFVKLRNANGRYWFECTKCHRNKALKAGSVLEYKNIGYTQFIDFAYFWCVDSKLGVLRRESGISSCEASVAWAETCRVVCEDHMLGLGDGMIGGQGIEVEIDESKFAKRKNNVGRLLREGWVFGGVERVSKRCFFVFVPDRTEVTLTRVIRERIRPGSIIISDMWAAYRNLSLLGYGHMTVNHSRNFVDPATGANTQTIESKWSHIKTYLRSKGRNITANMSQYFAEFMFKQRYRDEIFEAFLSAASCEH